MTADQTSAALQYRAGPYWEKKPQRAAKDIISKFLLALVSYENFSDSTLRAEALPKFFDREFINLKQDHLWVPDEEYYFFYLLRNF